MIDGTYRISMRTPAAKHDGAAVLSTAGNALNADFVVNGVGSLRRQGSCDGDEFALDGNINLYQVGRMSYRIDGLVAGDRLKATCITDRGTFDISGTRMER